MRSYCCVAIYYDEMIQTVRFRAMSVLFFTSKQINGIYRIIILRKIHLRVIIQLKIRLISVCAAVKQLVNYAVG